MIYYINPNNEVVDNLPLWLPANYSGIYISHMIGLLTVDDACKKIDDFVKKYNLNHSPIMFGWHSECYQHVIIHFMNDIIKNLVNNYTGYDLDRFHYHNGGLSIDENVEYYNSLPFDFLPNNLWLTNTCAGSYVTKTINRQIEIDKKLKIFLSMNRCPRTHRRLALSYLIKNDLLNKSFYSFDSAVIVGDGYTNNPLIKKYDKIVQDLVTDKIEPMYLSKKHGDPSNDRLKQEDIYYFDNSYFSLVQETFYDNSLDSSSGDIEFYESIFITEKTYRPIYFKHPFIMLGVKGTLAGLRKYGFKTFSPYFDESYDDIDDPVLRFEMALIEVKRLCSLPDDEWLTIQRELLPVLEYNYNLITSSEPTILRAKRK